MFYRVLRRLKGRSLVNSLIHKSSTVEPGSRVYHSSMDKHSFCGYDCQLYFAHIGAYTSISDNVIIGSGAHPIDWASTSPVFYEGRDSVELKLSSHARESPKNVYIGSDVWIGQGVHVLSGVSIGDGAVIGAGAVVTKDISPYVIAAGVPAQTIRQRFSPDITNELIELEWWKLPESSLRRCAQCVKDPHSFIKCLKN